MTIKQRIAVMLAALDKFTPPWARELERAAALEEAGPPDTSSRRSAGE